MANVTQQEITEFQDKLLAWFEDSARSFPWREDNLSNYELIIAEVLLQRTKAETVSGFYKKFIALFPTWNSIAYADLEVIENALRPIGLYRQRSKRLHSLANEMVQRQGLLPDNRKELETIPFLGQYIANAVELLIFKRRKPLIDVNMARVLERYFEKRKKADIRFDADLQYLAEKVVNHENSKEISWAMLDFAALICKASKPLCEICFVKSNCNYYINCQKM